MNKVLWLLLGLFLAVSIGCQSISQNTDLFFQDSARALGLDRPSMLHPRDNVPANYYSPYR